MWTAKTLIEPTKPKPGTAAYNLLTPAGKIANDIFYGARIENVPEFRLNTTAKYTFTGGYLAGLAVGGAARYSSETIISRDANWNPFRGGLTAGDFLVFDANASYPWEVLGYKLSTNLGIYNVLDEKYFEGTYVASPRRTWLLTTTLKFSFRIRSAERINLQGGDHEVAALLCPANKQRGGQSVPERIPPLWTRPDHFAACALRLARRMSKPQRQPNPRHTASTAPTPPRALLSRAWDEVKEFSGLGREATYLWPRWLVLRAVGLVFILVFAGILEEGQAIVGPTGIAQLDKFFTQLHQLFPNRLDAFLHAPSLFWLNTSAAMIATLSWLGLAAAVALTCNLWPRFALGACWLIFLSFITTWRAFSPAQLDKLMLEVALICLPFAPAGFRPGLGVKSPPRPIAVFMIRWLLFRIMLESGFVKIFSGDPHWRDFTAMEVMYETGPFPTIWGYLDHHLPHTYHLFEIALTYIAEFAAPLLAVFAGRRGRWFALGAWTLFQAGIRLTNNFGWLNTASIGLGLLLLDDQMIRDAVTKLRLNRLATFLSARAQSLPPPPLAPWRLNTLRAGLWLHFGFTLIFFVKSCGVPLTAMPAVFAWPAQRINSFYSANAYSLYATFEPVRFQVEFEGSNDGGTTWRPDLFRYIPQQVDEISPHIAPWFARFDATLQIEAWNGRKSPLYSAVAGHLLARNPEVMARFRADPFADRPATMIRIRGYELAFTDLATQRATGHYWKNTPRRLPADDDHRFLRPHSGGQPRRRQRRLAGRQSSRRLHVLRATLPPRRARRRFPCRGHAHSRWWRADRSRPCFSIYTALAGEGELGAEHYLGLCYEFGIGVAPDPVQAAVHYRAALARGYVQSAFSLGALLAADRLPQRQDIEALALLTEAIELAQGDDPYSKFVRDRQPALAQRLISRMNAGDIAKARQQAAARLQPAGPVQPPVH